MSRRCDPLGKLDEYPCHREFRRLTLRVMVDYAVGGRPRCEYATTLGAGGMFVQCEDPLPKNTTVKVRFRVGDDTTELIEMEARVAWSQTALEHGDATRDPGMGLQFTDRVAIAALGRILEKLT